MTLKDTPALPHRPPRTVPRRWLLALLLVVVLCRPSSSSLCAELTQGAKDAIDAVIAQLMEDQRVPGLSAAIVVDGKLVYEQGYGRADIENNVPATPQTIYRLASISKMLTGVAAMQLAEQGKLDLGAPIQKYVPSFPEKQAPITAELLLKHQSGIRHYRGDEVRSNVFYSRVADALEIFQDDPLLFSPGKKFSYTTYGFNLLGAAIEGASGQDYVDYVQQHVCRPAGMKNIQPDNPYKIIPHRAAGYRLHGFGKSKVLRNDYRVDVTNKIPGGGWCSTPGDLARFTIAVCDDRLIERKSLERMWRPQPNAAGEVTEVGPGRCIGLGCFIDSGSSQRRIYHSGGQPKVSTFLIYAPEDKSAVALMCNLRGTNLAVCAGKLMDIIAKPAQPAGPLPAASSR